MTADDYRRRINHGFAACAMSGSNPYRQQIAERLSAAGGLHAPSRTVDRFTRRDDARVDHDREVAECKLEGGLPF